MTLKKKLVIGTGKTGKSCISFFQKNKIGYKVFDTRDDLSKKLLKEKDDVSSLYRFKDFEKEFLDDIEEAIISPGLSLKHKIFDEIKKLSIPIITDIELCRRYSDIPIIAVSGTNGKTTVVSMLEDLLNKSDLKSIACGNNGVPMLTSLDDCNYEYLILELSSYQLEYINNMKVLIGLITNVEDDHLERHKNYENYLSIKKKIFFNCKHSICNISLNKEMEDIKDYTIYGFDNNSKKIFINGKINEDIILNDKNISYKNISIEFKGIHNLDNLLAVLSISEILNIDIDNAFSILASYKYPSHRIQFIKKHNEISWYNDSKSTNISSTIAAIKFIKKNIILILGGSEKQLNYNKLNSYIEDNVKCLILLGQNKEIIRKELTIQKPMIDVDSMQDAVCVAYENSSPGDSVLLSPASPSFDMFSDYEERGKEYIKAVYDITK